MSITDPGYRLQKPVWLGFRVVRGHARTMLEEVLAVFKADVSVICLIQVQL